MATNNSINSPLPTTVSNGGTGVSSLTAYAPIFGGTTTTGAVQSAASLGTAGTLLTSNGSGALGSFQTFYGSPYTTTLYYPASQIGHGLGTFITQGTYNANLFFAPFYVSQTATFTKIACYLVAGSAATNINMGVYASASTGLPTGSPLSNTTSGSIASTGSNTILSFTFGAAKTLTGGQIYWLAFTCSSATPTFASMQFLTNGLGAQTLASTAASCNAIGTLYQSFVYNTTLPSVGSLSSAANTLPLIALVAQ